MIEAYARSLSAAFQEAAERQGEHAVHLRVFEQPVQLLFAGYALVDKIIPALAHLVCEEGNERPQMTVSLWDSKSTGVPLPAKPWLTHDGSADVSTVNNERFMVTDQQHRYFGVDILHFYDVQRQWANFYVPDAQALPYWIESFPLRLLFHCWTLSQPAQLVHGAAVGLPDGGVLLAGRGGKGKSTAALACLASELSYAGDDYVLVQLQPSIDVFSLYNTAKIDENTLRMLPQLRPQGHCPDQTRPANRSPCCRPQG